ncbi:MAG: hotdog domain-containing protein [Bradymonadaceae bacterium]
MTTTDVLIRQRMGMEDAHYAGGLVDGAYILKVFGDVATELLIRHDGDEGLFRAYDEVDFLEPVYAGDYIEATGEITSVGNTSRVMRFRAHKVVRLDPEAEADSAAEVLDEPIKVCEATGTCVVPEERQG